MVELHYVSDGKEVVMKCSKREAEDMFRIAAKWEIEVLYNPICRDCVRRKDECVGTKNWIWTGCVYKREK